MMNYMDLLLTQAGKLPQKVFLVTETKRLTYEAVCDAALSYAALLQSLSCPKGTLLIVRKDPVAQLTAFLGAQKAGIDHFGRKAALAEFLINIVGPGISDIRAVFLEGHAKKEKIGPADIDLGLQKPGQDLAHHKT